MAHFVQFGSSSIKQSPQYPTLGVRLTGNRIITRKGKLAVSCDKGTQSPNRETSCSIVCHQPAPVSFRPFSFPFSFPFSSSSSRTHT